jgi:hypothetical protein
MKFGVHIGTVTSVKWFFKYRALKNRQELGKKLLLYKVVTGSQGSSVSIVSGYGLDDRAKKV